ncbi:U32 family peptidase [Candidatus Saganbacteria bacterium]|nr:U32 family peptidase [Candidatus Saganbacteria bacterium]
MISQHKPELLIPAGNLEKLETAVRFGADAVYVGAGVYSLRADQTAFSLKDLELGINLAHKKDVRVYLAMNIFSYDSDLPKMTKYLKEAIKIGIDAVIISDPGLIYLIKKNNLKVKIHLSTQTSTLNSEAVKFWNSLGVSRIVLGRELSLAQIKNIKNANPSVEIEAFVHGAMCMAYSGRCFLSKHMTGRSANRGECAHTCRWEYKIIEEKRPKEEIEVIEDPRGTYLMSPKDLCMIEHIKELKRSGIDSFKIEGRMKSAYYVAQVARIYRRAIDSNKYDPEFLSELIKISHRSYTIGFYFSDNDYNNTKGEYVRGYDFTGVVRSFDKGTNTVEVLGRNYFKKGDILEIIDPAYFNFRKLKVKKLVDQKGHELETAHNGYHVFIETEKLDRISPNSILRRKRS